jgi:S1-C subfamily serine protease
VKRSMVRLLLRIGVQESSSLVAAGGPYADIPRRPGGITTDHDFVDVGIRVLYDSNPRRAIVDKVSYPSPAFDAGLELGDELVAVNGRPIGELTEAQLSDLLAPSGLTVVNLDLVRLHKRLTFEIKPELWSRAAARIGRTPTDHGAVPKNCP